MTKLTAFWRRIPKPVRAGWITAWITFASTLLMILTSILPELASAISARNFTPFYDSLSIASTAAVSAVTAFLAGCVNALYRWLKPIEEAYRTDPPPADDNDRGSITLLDILVALLIVAVIVWLARVL